jgi:acetyl-CoA C-acetyltransferase
MSNSEVLVFDAILTPRGRGKVNGSLHTVKPVESVAAATIGSILGIGFPAWTGGPVAVPA